MLAGCLFRVSEGRLGDLACVFYHMCAPLCMHTQCQHTSMLRADSCRGPGRSMVGSCPEIPCRLKHRGGEPMDDVSATS